MKKLAILSAMMFAVALWFGGTVSADCPPVDFFNDTCDENNDHTDVSTVNVTSNGVNITVTVELCDAIPSDDKTKYRLHIDHWGTTALDDNPDCLTTSDDTMMIRGIGTSRVRVTGPGVIQESGVGTTTITFIVPYTDLVDGDGFPVEADDILLFWVDTHHKGIQDRAPSTDGENDCSKPDECDEVIQHELNDVP